MITYILFIIGFPLLIKGADVMVDGAASLAKKLNISNLVIGLTVVAFGTSAPEFVVNLLASFAGSSGLALGNIVGSNIANIFLILGVASLVYALPVQQTTVKREIPFAILSIFVLYLMVNDKVLDHQNFLVISRIDGLLLLSFFSIFMYYVFLLSKKGVKKDTLADVSQSEKKTILSDKSEIDNSSNEVKEYSIFKSILFVIIGIAGLVFGGQWIVEGAILIAKKFGMSEDFIGLTIVAIGTSLPELAATVVAAYKKNADMAIGGVIGSNIFNVFWVLGVSATILPIPVLEKNILDILISLIASLVLFIFFFIGKKYYLTKWQGGLFVSFYVIYIISLIIKN